MASGIIKVGLQKRSFKYDGIPLRESLAPEGTSLGTLLERAERNGIGTVLTIGTVVGSLIALNWYQNRQQTPLHPNPVGYDSVRPSYYSLISGSIILSAASTSAISARFITCSSTPLLVMLLM